ncbi:hypothetical protein AB0K52_20350 [Glycomyces sp. NPDC049804]|uniref:hypothetical protein n=1 Tax=Glycomyces sp. NPDC049804 TaxID=3154363 RepID=UPI00343FD965
MKIRQATGTAAVSLTALLMLAACGGNGDDGATPPGSGSTNGSETASADGGGDSAVYDEIASWEDPCEVLGGVYSDLTESLRAASVGEEFVSGPIGVGNPTDAAKCSNQVVWSEETADNPGSARGYVDLWVLPKSSEEEASTRYAELEADAREQYGEEFAEQEVTGWDEGILFLGDYGVRDAFKVFVRDGSYLIAITLETGSYLVADSAGNKADYTVEEARDYLLDEALPGVQSVVNERLEAAGVSTGE